MRKSYSVPVERRMRPEAFTSMSITIGKKQFKLTSIGLGAGLLALYFSGLSLLGVSLSVPYAFLWLIWTLDGIRKGLERQREEIEKISAR
jgi:hypothetical protein